jgi:hypothetical protein
MIESCWPTFYDDLVARTSIRGIIALPLDDGVRGFGALDLYLVAPGDVGSVTLSDALAVAREVVATFQSTRRDASAGADGPAWLDAPAAERRSLVWQAMGFVNAGLGIGSPDALALLRAHAYSEGTDLDELAVRVLDRDVPLHVLAPDADPTR